MQAAEADLCQGTLEQMLRGPIRQMPSFTMVRLQGLRPRSALVRRWDPDPRILMVRCPSGAAPTSAAQVAVGEDEIVVDSRDRVSVLRLGGDLSDRVLTFAQGEVGLFLLRRGHGPDAQQLPAGETEASSSGALDGDPCGSWDAARRPGGATEERLQDTRFDGEGAALADERYASPPLAALLSGASCPDWLTEEYEQAREHASSYAQIAALGLVARLWSPADPGEAGRHLSRALGGEALPSLRARARCDRIPAAVARRAASEAHARTRALLEEAEGIGAVEHTNHRAWQECLLSLAVARDELECVATALTHTGAATALADALSEMDQRWGKTLRRKLRKSRLSGVPRRLLAVGWQEPEAWWGMTLDSPCTIC